MATHVGVGTSEQEDAFQAGKDAVKVACKNAYHDFFDLLIVFASAKYDQQALLQGITSVCPNSAITGCSSAGEITATGPTKNSVAVMGITSDTMRFSVGLGCGLSQDARSAGQKCAKQAAEAAIRDRHIFVMFPDGLSTQSTDAIRGIQEITGTSFPIVGGSASDDYRFQQTYQYHGGKVFSDAVVGLLLGGEASVGIGVRHGWHAIGKEHEVTEAQGNIIKKLDGKAAFSMYEDYFGAEADNLKKEAWAKLATIYPLGMSIPDEDEYLVRYASSATADGSLICAAEVPQGSKVRLMIADKDALLDAALEATLRAKEGVKGGALKAVLIFDSVARKRVLGRHASEEIKVIKKALGESVPIIGFYSYGEQAPLKAERYIGKSYFHNETIVVVCIAEAHA